MLLKIKKYPWNEPDHKKRWWSDYDYNEYQFDILLRTRAEFNQCCNIDDLDPEKYTGIQMSLVSYGRRSDTHFYNVDHLNPEKFCFDAFYMVSNNNRIDTSKYKKIASKVKYERTISYIIENYPELLI